MCGAINDARREGGSGQRGESEEAERRRTRGEAGHRKSRKSAKANVNKHKSSPIGSSPHHPIVDHHLPIDLIAFFTAVTALSSLLINVIAYWSTTDPSLVAHDSVHVHLPGPTSEMVCPSGRSRHLTGEYLEG